MAAGDGETVSAWKNKMLSKVHQNAINFGNFLKLAFSLGKVLTSPSLHMYVAHYPPLYK